MWGKPNEPNGEIIGYSVRFREVSTDRVGDIINKDAEEFFHIVDKNDLPSGSGNYEVQVCFLQVRK